MQHYLCVLHLPSRLNCGAGLPFNRLEIDVLIAFTAALKHWITPGPQAFAVRSMRWRRHAGTRPEQQQFPSPPARQK
jgi:hypothetical protein